MIRAGLWLDAEKVTDLGGGEIRRTSEPHDVENAPETSWIELEKEQKSLSKSWPSRTVRVCKTLSEMV